MHLPTTCALVAAAALLTAPLASAGISQRPVNSGGNDSAHTTAKVLVAYPDDRPRPKNFLYPVRPNQPRAIRRGAPVLLDTHYRPGVSYSLGYVRPISRIFRYTMNGYGSGGGVVHDSYFKSPGFQTISGSDRQDTSSDSSDSNGNGNAAFSGGTSNAPAMPADRVGTVIAAGFAPVDTLPDATRNDPFALLNAGRLRDARDAFAAAADSPAHTAGEALAATLSGDLEAGRSMLSGLAGKDLGTLPLGETLTTLIASLKADMFSDDPTVSGVLDQMLQG